MADGWQTFPVEFSGGLITNLSPLQQGANLPGSARQLRNFEPSIEGGYKRILGFQKFDDATVGDATAGVPGTGVVRGLGYLNGKVLAVRNNDTTGEGELFESAGVGWTRKSTNSVRFDSGVAKVRMHKYNFGGGEKVMIVDGANYPFIYDGSTLTELTSAPVGLSGADHVINYKRLMVVANGNNLFISAPASDIDFTPANGALQDVYPANITGLVVFRDTLYVFTEKTISAVNATSFADVQRRPVATDLGCVEPDTIQEIAGDVIFMGPDGLRLLSGTDKIGDIGLATVTKNIQDEVNSFRTRHNSFASFVVRNKSQYRILGYRAGDSVANSQGLLGTQFATQGGGDVAWAETRGIKGYVAHSEYSGNQELIFFAHSDGYVYQLEQGNSFDGEVINASFFSPYLPVSDPTLRKTLYAVHTYLDPEGSFRATLRLNYDFGGGDVIQPDPIDLTNILESGAGDYDIGTYGTSSFATYEVDASASVNGTVTTTTATANVNGATSSSTSVAVDGNDGTIAVNQYVSGTGITGTPYVTTVTDQNNIVLSSAQTLANDTALYFSDKVTIDNVSPTIVAGQYVTGGDVVGSPTVVSVIDANNIVLSTAQTLSDNSSLSFSTHDTVITGTIYGDAVRLTLRKQVTGSGFVVSVEYTSSGSTQPFSLDAMALEYATESRR